MRNVIYSLCLLILTLWTIISIGRIAVNISKIFIEERQWLFLNDDQKRNRIFGDVYTYIHFINDHTKQGSILSFFDDVRTHYYGRYMLYPKKFVSYTSFQLFTDDLSHNQYSYVTFSENQRGYSRFEQILAKYHYKELAKMQENNHIFYIYSSSTKLNL